MSGVAGPAGLAIAAGSILAWSLLSVRLERWRISAAMLFVALGLVLTNGPLQVVDVQLHSHTIEAAAELALAMVLFTDASRVNFNRLRADAGSRHACCSSGCRWRSPSARSLRWWSSAGSMAGLPCCWP